VLLATAIILVISATLLLVRALRGPQIYDRILAVNAMGTKTVVLVSVIGFLTRPGLFLDIAVVYALVNFVATIAVLKWIEYKRLG
jgi:multicomponent Na+:H+ antiporter subunit F